MVGAVSQNLYKSYCSAICCSSAAPKYKNHIILKIMEKIKKNNEYKGNKMKKPAIVTEKNLLLLNNI